MLKQPPINTWGLNWPFAQVTFFTVEILPVFFLFWFLWIRRHDWVSGYMMGRGTSRQIIPQLCSYNTNTLITYHAYVTYMCKQEHIYHTMWHAMSRQWLLHTFWCVRPTIMGKLILMLYKKVICKRLNFCFIYLLLDDNLLVRELWTHQSHPRIDGLRRTHPTMFLIFFFSTD